MGNNVIYEWSVFCLFMLYCFWGKFDKIKFTNNILLKLTN
jgi:hypothetical protein